MSTQRQCQRQKKGQKEEKKGTQQGTYGLNDKVESRCNNLHAHHPTCQT